MLPDAGDDCAWLAAHLQSLTFQTLGVILISNMRCRARIADGKARAQAALGHAALCTSVMGPAAGATGLQPAVMGPTLAYSSPAQATGLAAPPSHRPLSDVMGQEPSVFIGCTGHWPRSAPATDHWALSFSVNRGCKDLAEEASCPS